MKLFVGQQKLNEGVEKCSSGGSYDMFRKGSEKNQEGLSAEQVGGYLFHIELRNESHRSCEGGGGEPLVKLTERHVVHGLGHV